MSTATALVLTPEESNQLGEFLQLVAGGNNGFLTAGLAVGWTPRRLTEIMSDDDVRELVQYAVEQKNEYVEAKLFTLIEKESFPAIQMYLYCQASHRGWRPPQQRVAHEHQGKIEVSRVQAIRQAIVEQLAQPGGVKALSMGGTGVEPVDADEIG